MLFKLPTRAGAQCSPWTEEVRLGSADVMMSGLNSFSWSPLMLNWTTYFSFTWSGLYTTYSSSWSTITRWCRIDRPNEKLGLSDGKSNIIRRSLTLESVYSGDYTCQIMYNDTVNRSSSFTFDSLVRNENPMRASWFRGFCTCLLSTFSCKQSYLKLRVSARSAADPVHAVVSLRGLGQRQVSLVDVFAPSQRHITHQQQPRAVRHTGPGVIQTGAVGGECGEQETCLLKKTVVVVVWAPR